jgi:hypothetical protein
MFSFLFAFYALDAVNVLMTYVEEIVADEFIRLLRGEREYGETYSL